MLSSDWLPRFVRFVNPYDFPMTAAGALTPTPDIYHHHPTIMASSPELPAMKRKRTERSQPLSSPLTAVVVAAPIVSFGSSSTPQVSGSTEAATDAAPRAPPRSPQPPNNNSFAWSFLSHPVLKHLRKWPGLASTTEVTVSAAPATPDNPDLASPSPPPPPSKDVPLKFARLLAIPPIASSIASGLYGRDLLSIRLLNSTFRDVLSTQMMGDGQRPYYHTLLLKSLLCTRIDLTTEPLGTACKSAGGNVGPCMLCATPICSVRFPPLS